MITEEGLLVFSSGLNVSRMLDSGTKSAMFEVVTRSYFRSGGTNGASSIQLHNRKWNLPCPLANFKAHF